MEFKRLQNLFVHRLNEFLRLVGSPKYWLHAAGIVLLTLGLYLWGRYNLAGMPDLVPSASEFDINDFYSAVANRRPVVQRDSVVVIVSVDGCDRNQIARALFDIDFCKPAAVGLDVFFAKPSENDSELIEAVGGCENLVLPVMLDYDSERGFAKAVYGSFFQDRIPWKPVGAVNLAGSTSLSVVRRFRPWFPVEEDDTVRSFSVELARIGRPQQYRHLTARGNRSEYIRYHSRQFDIIPAARVLQNREDIAGRIVIVGNVEDKTDVHVTPVDMQMNGTLVHAHSLSTILGGCYIEKKNNFVRWIWAVVAALVLVWFRVMFTFRSNTYSDLMIRILQFLLIWLCAYFGYKAFVDKGIYGDFSLPVLIGLGMLVADIWFAAGALYHKVIGLWKRK